jgi:hypothetical protein
MVSDSRSAGRPLEHLDVERLLGDDLFQAAVLILDLLQPLHFTELHRAVLCLPAVVRLLGDPVRAAQVRHLAAGFAFLDDRQDLLTVYCSVSWPPPRERRAPFYAA